MKSSFKPSWSFRLTVFFSIIGLVINHANAAADEAKQPRPEPPRPISASNVFGAESHGTARSPEEKEYIAITRKLREDDEVFAQSFRKAGAGERRKLRLQRLELMQPVFTRLNELGAAIRKHQNTDTVGPVQESVPVLVKPEPDKEIKGKSELDLARLGVAVNVLHQKAVDHDKSGAATSAGSASKK